MAEQSDEEMAKEYINSIMYAVPDVALMVPRSRPIKRCAVPRPCCARAQPLLNTHARDSWGP